MVSSILTKSMGVPSQSVLQKHSGLQNKYPAPTGDSLYNLLGEFEELQDRRSRRDARGKQGREATSGSRSVSVKRDRSTGARSKHSFKQQKMSVDQRKGTAPVTISFRPRTHI